MNPHDRRRRALRSALLVMLPLLGAAFALYPPTQDYVASPASYPPERYWWLLGANWLFALLTVFVAAWVAREFYRIRKAERDSGGMVER